MTTNYKVGNWSPEQMARCLGWFSIGLGVAQIIAPRAVARLVGLGPRQQYLMRMIGLRELTSGLGILTQRRPAGWVWSRVGGDALDLALLTASRAANGGDAGRLTAASAAVAGIAALDVLCSKELTREPKAGGDGAVHVEKSIIVNRSPEEVYAFWRDFTNLPRFMSHLLSVEILSSQRSHWVAKGPAGTKVEWDAEIITDTPNEVISWRSLEGADVDHAGSVRFERAPGGRGTIVRVKMQYRTVAGRVGATVVKLLGQSPEKQVKVDLNQFKQVMEAGEVARTEGQPTGTVRGSKVDALVRG
ncbi:MAG: SRPBCC family protein [Verrucomicrobiia bacterium]